MLAAAALLLAQEKDTKKSKDAKKSEASQAVPSDAPKSEQIPKDAVRVERNAYRYVDPQGKVWYYHQLPFGVSKYEAKPAETTPVNEEPAILVHDLGDSIEFQRNTPFGVSKWNRKKTDLTAEEKVAIAADEAKRSAGSKEAGAAPKEAAKEKNDKTTEKREKQ
jgi:hypothetical protein